RGQEHQHRGGHHDAREGRVHVQKQFLQPQEVPRRLGRVGRQFRGSHPGKGRRHENGHQGQEQRDGQRPDELDADQVGPYMHRLKVFLVHPKQIVLALTRGALLHFRRHGNRVPPYSASCCCCRRASTARSVSSSSSS